MDLAPYIGGLLLLFAFINGRQKPERWSDRVSRERGWPTATDRKQSNVTRSRTGTLGGSDYSGGGGFGGGDCSGGECG